MAENVCPRLERCIFFNDKMAQMPATAAMIKLSLCQGGNHGECARFVVAVAVGAENVPPTLYPSDTNKIDTTVASCRARN
jgi:hypothetical protein